MNTQEIQSILQSFSDAQLEELRDELLPHIEYRHYVAAPIPQPTILELVCEEIESRIEDKQQEIFRAFCERQQENPS